MSLLLPPPPPPPPPSLHTPPFAFRLALGWASRKSDWKCLYIPRPFVFPVTKINKTQVHTGTSILRVVSIVPRTHCRKMNQWCIHSQKTADGFESYVKRARVTFQPAQCHCAVRWWHRWPSEGQTGQRSVRRRLQINPSSFGGGGGGGGGSSCLTSPCSLKIWWLSVLQCTVCCTGYMTTGTTPSFIGSRLVIHGCALLTPSLPWCHLKTTMKSAKFETLQPFCLLFRTGERTDFHQNA